MKSLSLYQPKDTYIHRGIDPFTKVIYLICSIIGVFFAPNHIAAGALTLLNIIILIWAKELKRASMTIFGSFVLLLTIFVIQSLFNPNNHTLLFRLGPIHIYEEGFRFALTISFRVVNIIAASSVLVLTTSPTNVVEACVRRGLPAKGGYVITSILQIIPTMMSSAETIREAQQSRGMAVDGNLVTRFKAFLPLLGPIVMSSLMTIQDKAMALEVRGFSAKTKKTFFRDEHVSPFMPILRILIVVGTFLLLVWRFVQ
jgi:energy-coupling factor transport system permease protein